MIEQGNSALRVLGVHSPGDQSENDEAVKVFFEYLKGYAVALEDTPFIIVGDLNVNKKVPSIYLDQICEIKRKGYADKIDREITYFRKENTIDHVLVSRELEDYVTAQVIPREILELSDHAVIIVDVQI